MLIAWKFESVSLLRRGEGTPWRSDSVFEPFPCWELWSLESPRGQIGKGGCSLSRPPKKMHRKYRKSRKCGTGWPSCDGCWLLPRSLRGDSTRAAPTISWFLFTNIHHPPPTLAYKYWRKGGIVHWFLLCSAKLSPRTFTTTIYKQLKRPSGLRLYIIKVAFPARILFGQGVLGVRWLLGWGNPCAFKCKVQLKLSSFKLKLQ